MRLRLRWPTRHERTRPPQRKHPIPRPIPPTTAISPPCRRKSAKPCANRKTSPISTAPRRTNANLCRMITLTAPPITMKTPPRCLPVCKRHGKPLPMTPPCCSPCKRKPQPSPHSPSISASTTPARCNACLPAAITRTAASGRRCITPSSRTAARITSTTLFTTSATPPCATPCWRATTRRSPPGCNYHRCAAGGSCAATGCCATTPVSPGKTGNNCALPAATSPLHITAPAGHRSPRCNATPTRLSCRGRGCLPGLSSPPSPPSSCKATCNTARSLAFHRTPC